MGVKIMCAGCSADEREAAETAVRRAVASLPGSWTISLVKVSRQWSVTIDGPGAKGLTLVAPEGRIPETIRTALGKPGGASGPAPTARAGRAPAGAADGGLERRDRHPCQKCGQEFAVVYASAPGEGTRTVAVACPHCWEIGHFPVSEEAALNRDYRAEKVD
ncbi:MAG: hypothetical protein ACREMG_09690 [Gemmatimonadales bacterium]